MNNSIKKILLSSILLILLCFSVSFTAYALENEEKTDNVINHTVLPCDISKAVLINVVVDDSGLIYNGLEQKPIVKVYFNNSLLKEGTDYTLSYNNNINVGTGSVIINGIGNYVGTIEKEFKIEGINISKDNMIEVSFDTKSLIYDGIPVCPTVYVKYGIDKSTLLEEGVDYIIEYKNNDKIGKGKAIITGIGKYTGTFKKSFKIIPKQVTDLAVTSVTTSSLTLKWNSISGVSGYQILSYNIDKNKYVSLGNVSASKNTFTINKLTSNKEYTYCVRAYKNVSDKKYYGPYSEQVVTSVKPGDVAITSVTKSGNKLVIDWNKVACSGYEIFYSTDKKMKKNVKCVNVSSKKNTLKIKNIDKSKEYYVKIRAYSVVNNKAIYGVKSPMISSYFSNTYATYYSYYVNNPDRTNNLRIASKEINGTIVQPGQTFSFNDVVGPRTAAKGYKAAHVFSNSTTVSNEIGGGICQVASTMFNCVLKANVEIVERHQHTQRVSYVPLGRDAAIYGTAENFKWKNNTKHPIQIKMTVKDGKISCTFYTCKKVKPKKVNLKVSRNGNNFTLKRIVNGKTNYTCRSNY